MIGVITGDIINSRKNKDQGIWLEPLKGLFRSLGNTPKNWEIFLGDHFQLEIEQVENTFEEAIKIKSCIKSLDKELDVRMGIGIGEKTYDADRISESNGEVFINAGDAFEKVNNSKKRLAIITPWEELNRTFEVMIDLAALTIDKWTIVSAEVVKMSLDNPTKTQLEIANLIGIKSQPEISQARKRAGYDEIYAVIDYFRKRINYYSHGT